MNSVSVAGQINNNVRFTLTPLVNTSDSDKLLFDIKEALETRNVVHLAYSPNSNGEIKAKLREDKIVITLSLNGENFECEYGLDNNGKWKFDIEVFKKNLANGCCSTALTGLAVNVGLTSPELACKSQFVCFLLQCSAPFIADNVLPDNVKNSPAFKACMEYFVQKWPFYKEVSSESVGGIVKFLAESYGKIQEGELNPYIPYNEVHRQYNRAGSYLPPVERERGNEILEMMNTSRDIEMSRMANYPSFGAL